MKKKITSLQERTGKNQTMNFVIHCRSALMDHWKDIPHQRLDMRHPLQMMHCQMKIDCKKFGKVFQNLLIGQLLAAVH